MELNVADPYMLILEAFKTSNKYGGNIPKKKHFYTTRFKKRFIIPFSIYQLGLDKIAATYTSMIKRTLLRNDSVASQRLINSISVERAENSKNKQIMHVVVGNRSAKRYVKYLESGAPNARPSYKVIKKWGLSKGFNPAKIGAIYNSMSRGASSNITTTRSNVSTATPETGEYRGGRPRVNMTYPGRTSQNISTHEQKVNFRSKRLGGAGMKAHPFMKTAHRLMQQRIKDIILNNVRSGVRPEYVEAYRNNTSLIAKYDIGY